VLLQVMVDSDTFKGIKLLPSKLNPTLTNPAGVAAGDG
jgi:hypothetical protein